jgi:hypothetical protein
MRFRKTSTPPPFLNSRHQRRLIMLAGLLVLVLLAMRVAAKPETWSWLFLGQKPATETPDRKQPARPRPLKADEFRAGESKGSGLFDFGTQREGRKRQKNQRVLTPLILDLTLDPLLLANVEDGTYSVRFAELDGYYAILSRVAGVPQQALLDLAKRNGPVPFSVLRNEPKSHRGRAITIEGKLGSLKLLPNSRPGVGLKTVYEAWIVTPESDNNPYRVVFSELPAGLEPQDRFAEPPEVRATGYFFKVQTYEVEPGDDQSHTAPLLLAKRIQPVDAAAAPQRALGLAPYVIGFALLLGGILAVFIWRFSRGDRQFAEQQLQRYDASRTADPSELKHLETMEDPQEFFRRLSEADAAAESGIDAPR